MAGTLFWIDAIQVFIAAEDHPPPHVHAVHTGEGWVARFRFSFLSDVTGLYRLRRRGRKPTEATLDRMAEAIMAHLPACRESWWMRWSPSFGQVVKLGPPMKDGPDDGQAEAVFG